MTEALPEWHDFFVAEVGASAALAGLIAVAVSINLDRILKIAILPGRAAESLIYLGGALLVASFCLIPQGEQWLAGEVMAVGAAIWLVPLQMQIRAILHRGDSPLGWVLPRIFMGQVCSLPIVAGGVLLLLYPPPALHVLAAGILSAMVVGLINTWVLLVEILR